MRRSFPPRAPLLLLVLAACAATISGIAGDTPPKAEHVVLALPAQTLIATTIFVAEDLDLFRQAGLDVDIRTVVGVGAPNAVLAGSADFTMGTGTVFLRAAAKGQRFYAIANMIDRPLAELVLRRDVAQRLQITDRLSLATRGQRLKGLTIAVQGVGSMIHAWARYVAVKGGLDPERDIQIAPMDPSAMLLALQRHAIDGYATSLPFTTQAVLSGQAIMLASSLTDAPELLPFAYGLVYAKADTCTRRREVCMRMGRALLAAAAIVHRNPDKVLTQVLQKRFPAVPPDLLRAAWQRALAAHAADIKVTEGGLVNSEAVSVGAHLLNAADTVKDYRGLFTNEFVQ